MKIITMTAYRRPAYFKQVLDHLALCEGVNKYSCLLQLEPGCQEVHDIAYGFRDRSVFADMLIHVNDIVRGCNWSTLHVIDRGFVYADRLIHLEDDTVPLGHDFLRYMEWALDTYREDQEIFSVTGYNRIPKPWLSAADYYAAARRCWFIPWGWATWQDRWQTWFERQDQVELSQQSWDAVLGHWVRGNGLNMLRPLLPRIRNIGAELGAFCPGPEWHRDNQYNEFGSWDLDPPEPRCEYYETQDPEVSDG